MSIKAKLYKAAAALTALCLISSCSTKPNGPEVYLDDKNEEIVFGVSPMSMLKRYGLDGILYISVEYDSMFETFKQTLQNNYGIVIFDEKGNAVYEKAFFDKKYLEYELNAAQLLDQKKNQENEYTILSETSSVTSRFSAQNGQGAEQSWNRCKVHLLES